MKIGKYCARHRKYCRHRKRRRITVASGQIQRGVHETSRVPKDLAPIAQLIAEATAVAVETAIANTGYFQRRYTPPQPRKVKPGRRLQPRLIPTRPGKYTNGRTPYKHRPKRITQPSIASKSPRAAGSWRMGGRSAIPTGYLKIFN